MLEERPSRHLTEPSWSDDSRTSRHDGTLWWDFLVDLSGESVWCGSVAAFWPLALFLPQNCELVFYFCENTPSHAAGSRSGP